MTRVLIADDREENLYLLRSLLEAHEFHVEDAHNGEEALQAAQSHPPDLIISDLLMPKMDGYTLLRAWKADEQLRRVPFMVYTATYTDEEDRRLALDLGADDFIVKPCEPDELLQRIRDQLTLSADGSPRSPREPASEEDDLLETYNRVLVRKLEKKMEDMEVLNGRLREELAERNRARDELERNAALLRIAGRTARLGGWSYQAEESVVTWSDETAAIHGVAPGHSPTLDEMVASYTPEHRQEMREAVEECIREGTPFDLELQVVLPHGERRWLRVIGEGVPGEEGGVQRIQGAVQDISENKLLEQRFHRSQRMESIATLTGGMAHDLNNLLTPIILSIETLKDGLTTPEDREMLGTIEACARRGSEMVKQVLSFARGVQEAKVPVNLERVLGDLSDVVRDTFPDTIELSTRVSERLWGLRGDPTQLHQVFLNVLVNARDALPGGGRIDVTADNVQVDDSYAAMSGKARPGPHIRISVTDTGTGMPSHVVQQIFDPLFTTKPEGKGTGIGLSAVTAIVQNHDGFVNVYSEEGVGTTFRFHFPAVVEDGRPVPVDVGAESWQGEGQLVLVADDEAAVRSITQQTLEAYGYRAIAADGGVEAMRIFRERGSEIDVVLTDVSMPGMDGAELVRAIREIDPTTRCIAASGIGTDGGDERAQSAGARHFLSKPYTAEALLSVVHEALSHTPESSSSA